MIDGDDRKARADWFGRRCGIFDFLRDALTLDLIGRAGPPTARRACAASRCKLQQFTGPMMAKSLEDTAFYRYHRLLALNEVGGDPAAAALSGRRFSRARCETRASEWPHGLTATATHDTKRGEDARARILALAELPGEWASAVGATGKPQRAASRHRRRRCARPRPTSNTCSIRR